MPPPAIAIDRTFTASPASSRTDYGSFGRLTNPNQERGNQTRVWSFSDMENDMSAPKPRFAVAIATASISACSTLTGAAIGAAAASIAGTVVDDNR